MGALPGVLLTLVAAPFVRDGSILVVGGAYVPAGVVVMLLARSTAAVHGPPGPGALGPPRPSAWAALAVGTFVAAAVAEPLFAALGAFGTAIVGVGLVVGTIGLAVSCVRLLVRRRSGRV